ncbi:MAG: HAMP domain-containing histidine kinase [Marinisporobacter sp.]|jgi:signal transduction histidine kinase|nr:HAMP domain-containing histidine kinase [Marinisporobacter sp.]
MKLWQKLYIFTLILFILIFNLAGIIFIEKNHNASLKREVNRCFNEALTIYSGVDTSLPAFRTLDRYIDLSDFNRKIIYKFADDYTKKSNGIYLEILDKKNQEIYSNIDFALPKHREEIKIEKINERRTIIRDLGKNTYIFITNLIEINGSTFKLTYMRDISSIYEQKKEQYDFFFQLEGIAIVVFSIFMFFISRLISKPVKKLMRATKRITKGNYHERVNLNTKDELGILAENFNLMAEAVEENIHQLEKNNLEKERFIDNFTHELKTPLTSIIGYANLLRTTKCDEETFYESLNFIYQEGKRLEELSFDLMDLIVLRREAFNKEKVNIKKLLIQIKKVMQPKLKEKNIEILMDAEPIEWMIEKNLIQILLSNLIDNAYKASERDTKIYLNLSKEKEKMILEVKDEGIGIPKEHIDKILEPFYMVDKARTRANHGAGLGLSICKRIVEVHGAVLKINSIIHKGTSIKIIFKDKEDEIDESENNSATID